MRTYLRVGAIIFYEGKLLTTKMMKEGQAYHVLPGGGVEGNETIIEAIKREVEEEVGLKIKKLRISYIRELNLKIEGGGRGVEFYFYVEEYEGTPKKGFDPEEKDASFEEMGLLDLEELGNEVFHPVQLVDLLKSDREDEFQEFKHLGIYDYP